MKNGMSTKMIEIKEYSTKEVGLLVQAVLTELLIVFGIISMMSKEFLGTLYFIISMIMFTMAYNNKKIYKKKNMTAIYTIVGLFVAITTIIEYIL